MEDVMATTLEGKIDLLGGLDGLFEGWEAWRKKCLGEIERHRAALGGDVRRDICGLGGEVFGVDDGGVVGGAAP